MTQHTKKFAAAIVACALAAGSALADTTITTFDNFNMSGLFGWSDATIVSGPTSYSVTDSGYGSGYYDINPNVNGAGETILEVTLTLSGGVGSEGQLGPIVALVDGDGTFVNFAWYGQSPGTYVLTAPINNPALDLSTLDFFHLQLDPSGYAGAYTVEWQNMRLTGVPEPSSMALVALGAVGLGIARRIRR